MTELERSLPTYDGIVLAGGRARRLGGHDKTRLDVGGTTLLDRVLAAASGARTTVVVGEQRPTSRTVSWTREIPVGGGPAAAVTAGLDGVGEAIVVLLAGDLPFVTRSVVEQIVAACGGTGAIAVDSHGAPQWLLSAWPTALLRTVDLAPGGSLRDALGGLDARWIPVDDRDGFDCDTPTDLHRARELA
jgi:molybdopterin-guanine dinucleotide biosynthesis protein A